MNDDIREKLSAYLDGALSDADRRAVEVELSSSAELARELEALRAVSNAVKGLPKEKLPAGFLARLEARRAREEGKPARDYYILPPAYRPLAFALSTAVVALVVWDKTRTPETLYAPRPGWDSEKVAVKSAAEAPASIDVSGQIAAMDQKAAAPAEADAGFARQAKKEASGGAKLDGASTLGKHISAPGKPLGFAESQPAAAPPPAASIAALDALEPGQGGGSTIARNEEERSAINERLYKGFEEEKKRMGIARIMDKDTEEKNLPAGGREMMALQATPDAARLDDAVPAPAAKAPLRAKAKAAKRAAAPVKALALKSADALQAAWAAAGLPGEPPAVEFPGQMAVFLAGPAGSGIVEVQERKRFLVVVYKDAGFADPSARVKALAPSSKPVVVKLAQ